MTASLRERSVPIGNHHAEVSFELDRVTKVYQLENYNAENAILCILYLKYRELVANIYPNIPRLLNLQISSKRLIVQETVVKGIPLSQLITSGHDEEWINASNQLFLPLVNHLLPGPINIGPYVSDFPLQLPLDIKPANIIVSEQGEAVPIDFFPPLLVDPETGMFVHVRNPDEQARIAYSYGDLEVLLAKHYFMTKALNPLMMKRLLKNYIQLCNQIDPSGNLSERLMTKAVKSNRSCPQCPYCHL